MLHTYATFITNDIHRNSFINGTLVEEWSATYPMLFDSDDIRIAINQRRFGYHYYEWFAAILIYHTTGFLSLIEAYAYKKHIHKQQILETLVASEILDFIKRKGRSSVTQCPDLLVYSPISKDWFFCEVKGPHDKLREKQMSSFKELAELSGKDIKIVHFQNVIPLSPVQQE
jgi:hypothetical protein